MTWDARDVTTPLLPMDIPHTTVPSTQSPPPSPIAMPPPLEDADEWAYHLSPADRELVRQQGLMTGEQWDAWRHIATRGIDGIL